MIGKAGLIAILALALLSTGCSDDGKESEQGGGGSGQGTQQVRDFGSGASDAQARQPEAALRRYLDARAEEEWQKACASLAKSSRRLLTQLAARSKQVSGDDCPTYIEASTEKLSDRDRASLADITVDSVRIDSNRGYVLYTDAAGEEFAMPIKREGGRWKIAAGGIASSLT